MKCKTIRQQVTIHVKPSVVYEALMDSRKHSRFTGSPARISRSVGGKIQTYGDYVEGVNLDLTPNRRIIQAWRASDWPKGHYSRVTVRLKPVKSGTRLECTQSGVPEGQYESIKQGWIDYYWKPLKSMLEKS